MSDEIWHLFTRHRQPFNLAECYVGLQNKSSDPFLEFAIWDGNFFDAGYCGKIFGDLDPALLLPGVYWCFASQFPNEDAAKRSFKDFLAKNWELNNNAT